MQLRQLLNSHQKEGEHSISLTHSALASLVAHVTRNPLEPEEAQAPENAKPFSLKRQKLNLRQKSIPFQLNFEARQRNVAECKTFIIMAGNKRKAPDDEVPAGSGAGAESITEPRPIGRGPKPCKPNPGRPHRPAPGVAADGYFRHLYESEPDFTQLAKQDPGFAAVSVFTILSSFFIFFCFSSWSCRLTSLQRPWQPTARFQRSSGDHAADKDIIGS